MRASRRRFLALAALGPTGLLGCSDDPPRPDRDRPAPAIPPPTERWDPSGRVDRGAFAWGVQTGDTLPDAVLVSVRQFERARIRLRLARWTGAWEEQPPPPALVADDGVAQIELVGLAPDTEYNLVATDLDGGVRSEVARFRTPPHPGLGDTRTVRFAVTCCFGMAGSPFLSASRVAGLDVDFVVLLGDTVYVPQAGAWEDHWTKALQIDGLRELLLSASVVATWDDHEVLNDWVWEDQADDALVALDAFRRALPQRVGDGGSGIWRRLAWGDVVELFVLDTRGERSGGELMSEDQLTWLIDGLADSAARWKVVATSVPITDLTRLDPTATSAGWLWSPPQRARVLDAVRGRDDVVWVAGDIHMGVAGRVGAAGQDGDDQYEVICGPAGSSIAVIAPYVEPDAQHERIVGVNNTVVFEVDAGELRFAYHGARGVVASGVRLREDARKRRGG